MPSRPPIPFHDGNNKSGCLARRRARRRADADPSAVPTKYFAGIPRRGCMELHVRCLPHSTAAQAGRQARGAVPSRDAHARTGASTVEGGQVRTSWGGGPRRGKEKTLWLTCRCAGSASAQRRPKSKAGTDRSTRIYTTIDRFACIACFTVYGLGG